MLNARPYDALRLFSVTQNLVEDNGFIQPKQAHHASSDVSLNFTQFLYLFLTFHFVYITGGPVIIKLYSHLLADYDSCVDNEGFYK